MERENLAFQDIDSSDFQSEIFVKKLAFRQCFGCPRKPVILHHSSSSSSVYTMEREFICLFLNFFNPGIDFFSQIIISNWILCSTCYIISVENSYLPVARGYLF